MPISGLILKEREGEMRYWNDWWKVWVDEILIASKNKFPQLITHLKCEFSRIWVLTLNSTHVWWRAEFSWFSTLENELKSADFLAKKTSWIQLIFYLRKRAEISWFYNKKNELNSVDFLAKETSWIQLIFYLRKRAEISWFST